jgi:hypothetical protein
MAETAQWKMRLAKAKLVHTKMAHQKEYGERMMRVMQTGI